MKRFKIVMSLMAAFIMAGTSTAFAQEEGTYDDLVAKFTKAGELYGAKNYAEVAPLFEQIIKIGIEIGEEEDEKVIFAKQAAADSYRRAGTALAGDKKYDEALELLAKGRAAAEKHKQESMVNRIAQIESQIYTVMAAEAFNNKDYTKAVQIYKKGYDANPKDAELGLNLAMSYLEMTPPDTMGYVVYGQIIALEEVHTKYKPAADKAKERYVYYKLLSAANQANVKDYAGVIATTSEAVAIDPASAEAYMMMIQAATNTKNFRKVVEEGDKAAAAQSAADMKSDVYFMMGAAYENLSNNAKAIESYRKVASGKNVATAKTQIGSLQ